MGESHGLKRVKIKLRNCYFHFSIPVNVCFLFFEGISRTSFSVRVRSIVIKSNGGADQLSFQNAIDIAKKAVHSDIPFRIAKQVESHLEGVKDV